ncbi:2-hydroxychromene-2-carboxylate isomerase [Pseudophaeobacter leonis]|uniref:2-hydroxychromene-2-carboxylate isomerase n=1 Tax=Pseudophaeobacter leonis TaxID=1144477 RepID=UPI0019D358F8|nr:2-hydroxychromene-2-carboxylate isomerase [Pseudophaeobacter leonis]
MSWIFALGRKRGEEGIAMTKTVDFIFDFGSPNAYLVHKVLPKIAERTGARFNYIPCLLGGVFKSTGNQSPLQAYAKIPAKMDYERLEMQRFITEHQLSRFTFNPNFPVNTLMLMRGAVAVKLLGKMPAYCDIAFKAMWEDGRKMDDPSVFAETFTAAGLDGDAILTQTQDPKVKAALAKNTADAVHRGVFGIPTFFVDDAMFFGKERLSQLAQEIRK